MDEEEVVAEEENEEDTMPYQEMLPSLRSLSID
jgi:hypothetical protein